jgi:hypothetical protein
MDRPQYMLASLLFKTCCNKGYLHYAPVVIRSMITSYQPVPSKGSDPAQGFTPHFVTDKYFQSTLSPQRHWSYPDIAEWLIDSYA